MIDKAELRAAARARRKALAQAAPDAAQRLAGHAAAVLDALFPGEARQGRRLVVALYQAQGSEAPAGALSVALLDAGADLALPVATARDAALSFRRWTPGDPLEIDAAGCPAPLDLAETVDPDLIVTPLLAFDAAGGRLGQGGGYYDRTFAARPEVARIGLAYAGQAVEALALEPHDQPLHGVLTEAGYRPARRISH